MYTPINIITSVVESITFLWIMFYLTNITSLPKIFSSTHNILLIIFSFTITYLLQINENLSQILKGFIVIFLHFLITKYISNSKPKEALTAVIFTYVLECLLQMPGICTIFVIIPKYPYCRLKYYAMCCNYIWFFTYFGYLPLCKD